MRSSKGNVLVYLLASLLVIALLGGLYLYKSSQTTPPSQNSAPSTTKDSKPPVPTGFKQYTNKTLNFGFNYSESEVIEECADTLCLSISSLTLRLDALKPFQLSLSDPTASLLATDLYCNASGPGVSIICQNTEVKPFTNPLGFKGFKVTRSKSNTAKPKSSLTSDFAFVFPLPQTKKAPDGSSYTGILLQVDTSNESNLTKLQQLAYSFFLF